MIELLRGWLADNEAVPLHVPVAAALVGEVRVGVRLGLEDCVGDEVIDEVLD